MKFALFCILTLASALVFAENWLKSVPGHNFVAGGYSFTTFTWNDGWKGSTFSQKTAIPDAGYPKTEKNGGYEFKAAYHLAKGTVNCLQKLQFETPEKARYTLLLTSPEPIKIDGASMGTIVSNKDWKKNPFLINGKIYDFPAGKTQLSIPDVRELAIPSQKEGTVFIRGKFNILMVDISKSSYSPDSRQIRIEPIPASGMLKRIAYELELTWIPEKTTMLDLRSAMNMGFRDDVDGDGKGGWTDQGASNDLRRMTSGRMILDNVEMNIVDPAGNNGKSCIALRGNARKYFPSSGSAAFEKPIFGNYLYLLHGTAWDAPKETKVGDVVCTYTDGTTEKFEVQSKVHVANFWQPQPLPKAAIGWRGDNDVAAIGLYVTRFPLAKSGLHKLAFESAGTSVWMIAGASVSDKQIRSKEARKRVMKADSEWIPIRGSHFVEPGSLLDFSAELDAPAGKYGFAQNKNGQIVFEKNDRPVRFYGANLCFSANYLKNKADINFMADSFARIGYNLVRFHHFDRDMTEWKIGDGTDIKKDLLDSFDYTLAAFKKRGIYVTMDLFISRNIGKNAIPGYPKGLDRGSYKALVWGDPACMENFLTFANKLMSHINPYTGIAWKDEPAIINLDLVNEDAVAWTTKQKNSKPVFDKHFDAFMKQNNLTTNFYNSDRFRSLFLTDFYPKSYRKMEQKLRTLGIRQMLCDQNHSNDILTMLTREPYDLVENHFYWCHPAFLNHGWGGPALVQNISAISKFGGSMTEMFKSRAIGKPYSITEWDFVSPNRCNSEGAFLMGAYGALQDWNAACRFSYEHREKELVNRKGVPEFFNIANDPLRLLSERAGILFFLRRDIDSSKITVPVLLNRRHFAKADAPAQTGIVPERIGLIAKTGNIIFETGRKVNLPADAKAVIYTENDGIAAAGKLPAVSSADHLNGIAQLEAKGILPKGSEDFRNGIYRSTTGELEMDVKNLTFKAVSPRSEGFVLEEGKTLNGRFAAVSNRKNFSSVLIAAMDKKNLKESERYLLLHLTDTKSTGMIFADEDMLVVEDHGRLPLLARNGKVEITLNRNLKGYKLYTLGFDGRRRSELPLTFKNGKTFFELQTAQKGEAVAAYELTNTVF